MGRWDGDGERTGKVLLAQHEVLRSLTIDMVQVARRLMLDGIANYVAVAQQLADALATHNRLEEQVLGPLLLSSDAWSQMRIAEMLFDHRQEHDAFVADLRYLASVGEPSIELEARSFEVAAAIYRHMELEEIEYLNAEVLRDEVVPR